MRDDAHDKVLVNLDRGFQPASPVGADLGAVFGNLVDQASSSTFPGHSRFEPSDEPVTVRGYHSRSTRVARRDAGSVVDTVGTP